MQGKAQPRRGLKSFESVAWKEVGNYGERREFHGDTGGLVVPRVDRTATPERNGQPGGLQRVRETVDTESKTARDSVFCATCEGNAADENRGR
jgi:hypothetical protein